MECTDPPAIMSRVNAAAERLAKEPVRVVVIDDHPAIALAVEAAINAEGMTDGDRPSPPLLFVGAARNADDGIALVRRTGPDAPDVALCDVQLEAGTEGLRVVDAARAAGCAVIVLTSFDRSALTRAAFERGAAGFLHKGTEMGDVLRAIRIVASGGTAFSAAALDAARFAPRPPSEREVAVMRELHRGSTSDEIGGRLGISARTVESHLRRLFDRYGVVSRTELAVLSLREGWIEGGLE
jgi:two-component system NarL family response regulator